MVYFNSTPFCGQTICSNILYRNATCQIKSNKKIKIKKECYLYNFLEQSLAPFKTLGSNGQ